MAHIIMTMMLIFQTVLSADVDWRDVSMAPVGDQGSCGSCVGFAIAGALDWHVANLTGRLTPLSTQYLVDCGIDTDTGEREDGCNGGVINSELKQIMREQYLPYDQDYHFVGNYEPGRCSQMGATDRFLRNALADVWIYDYIPISMTPEAIREALQSAPTIHGMYIGIKMSAWEGSGIVTDGGKKGCLKKPSPHAMTFVGWQSNNGNPYYIVRGSYGNQYGDHGYVKYADNTENEACRYTHQAYSLVVGRRRELEYRLGKGRLTFKNARRWCQELGEDWDLAHVPTEMHNFAVYDLFTANFGSDKKNDEVFNYFWIGLFNTKNGEGRNSEKWVWVDGHWETQSNEITGEETKYYRFKKSKSKKKRYTVVNKVHPGKDSQRGRWTVKPPYNEYRFVCSRYRKEECPRISHRSVENAHQVTFLSPHDGSETLEVVDGTRAKVECMEGSVLSGEVAECVRGEWSRLPTCNKSNA